MRRYTNFFQPVMKLIRKERVGAKVKKTYARPCTPYQRLASSSALSKHAKQQLRAQYASLNPPRSSATSCGCSTGCSSSPVALQRT
jgi:hypothetical protein